MENNAVFAASSLEHAPVVNMQGQKLKYDAVFDPSSPSAEYSLGVSTIAPLGDRRDGLGYVYTDDIVLRVNVAIATGRPLLVSGPPGCGKSSLAYSVAKTLRWRYYEKVITSRTQARDLLWRFDTLRRLNDAEYARLQPSRKTVKHNSVWSLADLAPYVEPGVLWWAFNPTTATYRGFKSEALTEKQAEDPNQNKDAIESRAIVLLDEIDKADPDVPNDLLVPLGSLEFQVEETQFPVQAVDYKNPPLIIITTNGERDLPNAFLRRCLILKLERATKERLVSIAIKRFEAPGADPLPDRRALYESIAEMVDAVASKSDAKQPPPSTAEYLDTLSACLALGVRPTPHNEIWNDLVETTLWKQRDRAGVN
jgi:MoxR-like ATPase